MSYNNASHMSVAIDSSIPSSCIHSEQHMQTDSSYSRTYLTAVNNPYQQIHNLSQDPKVVAERQARNEQLKQLGASTFRRRQVPSLLRVIAARSGALGGTAVVHATEKNAGLNMADVDDDINRPPESSDDEEAAVAPVPIEAVLPTPISTQSSQPKRPLQTSNGNRRTSKRLKVDKEETLQNTMPETSSGYKAPEEPDWLSERSQSSQKRRFQGYGSRKTYEPPPATEAATPRKRGKGNEFVEPPGTPLTPASKRSERKLLLPTQSPSRHPLSPVREFMMPDDLDLADLDNRKRDNPGSLKKSRQRRGSDSSLSSADEFIDYDYDEATLAHLNTIDGEVKERVEAPKVDSDHVLCPMCKHSVLKADIDLPSNPSKLSPSKRQKFCYDHRIRDAKNSWAERGYPDIAFDSLGSSPRLRKHVKTLLSMIQRKSSSFYLAALDDAVTAANGNQTAIKRYFDVTALTTIHNGYYGPRGAKVISAAIAEDPELSKALKKATKSDKSLRLAGAGRAIDCVLLPEILVRLVVEDMRLGTGSGAKRKNAEEEARKVLEESVDVGLMLCGDDDHVEAVEDADVLDM